LYLFCINLFFHLDISQSLNKSYEYIFIIEVVGGIKMPNKDGTGPRSGSKGPRDGRGKGKGKNSGEGIGKKKGGKKGNC
jgi:hypothetical protein